MKVSEAVEQLQVSPIVDDGLCVVTHRALATLLASHEALRLAGEAVTYRVSAEAIEALSLAVEDASK